MTTNEIVALILSKIPVRDRLDVISELLSKAKELKDIKFAEAIVAYSKTLTIDSVLAELTEKKDGICCKVMKCFAE